LYNGAEVIETQHSVVGRRLSLPEDMLFEHTVYEKYTVSI